MSAQLGARSPRAFSPEDPCRVLPGIGVVRAAALARAGIATLRDLLLFAPRSLAPFPAAQSIADLPESAGALVRIGGTVARLSFSRFGRRSLLRVLVEDHSGKLPVLFFNQAWLRERFKIGEPIEVLGRIVESGGRSLSCQQLGGAQSPLPSAGELVAEYPAIEGLSPAFVAELCRRALQHSGQLLREVLEPSWLKSHALAELSECPRGLHAPRNLEDFSRASRRTALERALSFQARILERRKLNGQRRAARIECSDAEERALLAQFPFVFTAGQLRIAAELRDDLSRSVPMRRLLQGDVGSGKTALGLYACLLAAHSGLQSAFMAPTELLAEQHFLGLRRQCEAAGLRAILLSGSLSAQERRAALRQLAEGRVQIAFGTHALFSEDVTFARLGLAVIDEQHRFGVGQRQKLTGKGEDAHLLLMSATPIPRSLALTVFGDLDVSILREKPPGRGTVSTRWVRKPERAKALEQMRAVVSAGERMYWVVPRIGEASDGQTESASPTRREISAESRYARLLRTDLARRGVELVHGRLPAAERAARLERFRRGEVAVLVATTVIEVGVDVPEATLIVIEGAERLGLAQLHQLRGRVGRSSRASTCLLYGSPKAAERLLRLEQDSDGFSIAEADLAQRGMGDLSGLRQAGVSTFDAGGAAAPEQSLLLARELLLENAALAAEYLRPNRSPAVYDA
jgi:ATP-dependent DNA helicase RecG